MGAHSIKFTCKNLQLVIKVMTRLVTNEMMFVGVKIHHAFLSLTNSYMYVHMYMCLYLPIYRIRPCVETVSSVLSCREPLLPLHTINKWAFEQLSFLETFEQSWLLHLCRVARWVCEKIAQNVAQFIFIKIITFSFLYLSYKSYHPVPWRDSISRSIAPVYSVTGGDDTTRPRRRALLHFLYYWNK
jgi:hypothetical protein